jgi:hypothetical protein
LSLVYWAQLALQLAEQRLASRQERKPAPWELQAQPPTLEQPGLQEHQVAWLVPLTAHQARHSSPQVWLPH